jgi:hypothetical protein
MVRWGIRPMLTQPKRSMGDITDGWIEEQGGYHDYEANRLWSRC